MLAVAVLRTRNGEISGFEDFYLLTCRNTLSDIQSVVSDDGEAWKILREVYGEVWRRRDSLPETGIVRPWIRLLIRDISKRLGETEIEEFSGETSAELIKDTDGRSASTLIQIEEELGILELPEALQEKRNREGAAVSIMKFLLSLGLVGLSVFAAVLLVRSAGREARTIGMKKQQSTQETIHIQVESAEAEAEEAIGWNQTKKGRRFKNEDGSWREAGWFEEGGALYYMDGEGYALTGTLQIEHQNFLFDTDGTLQSIKRSYEKEQNETILSVQLKRLGREEEAEGIIDNSITLDNEWIYYLIDMENGDPFPSLFRSMQSGDETELIAESVSGYTVQRKNVWYCTDRKIFSFSKGEEGAAVGKGYTVREENNCWYLKDDLGRDVSAAGGYQAINGRIYRVESGRIKYVKPDVQKIDAYSFQCEEAGISPVILRSDGQKYLWQGQAIDALAVLGGALYYSTVVSGDAKALTSQIWRVDIYTGEAENVSGNFPGRILTMYPYPERDMICMEYRPGSTLYGKIAVITGNQAYLLRDEAARSGSFGNGNDLLQPVWASDGKIFCYWNNCSEAAASDGTIQILESRTLSLSEEGRARLGSGGKDSDGPVFFQDRAEQDSAAEEAENGISEDEMLVLESGKRSEIKTAGEIEKPAEAAEIIKAPPEEESEAVGTAAAETVAPLPGWIDTP